MSLEDLNNNLDNEEINTSGFDAISETFEKIYTDQKDPLHYRPVISYMLGGKVLNDDGSISLDKAEEAIELLQKCWDAGIFHQSIQSDSTEYWTAYNAGLIAAFPGPGANAAYYETNVDPTGNGGYGDIGIAPIMKFAEDGPATYIHNTEYWAISENTDEPEIAADILKYLTQTVEADMLFCNVNEAGIMAKYSTGFIPGLEAVASGEGVDPWPAYGGEKVVSILSKDILENKENLVLPFVDRRSAEIGTIISTVLGEMFLSNTYPDAASAVAAMKAQIEAI